MAGAPVIAASATELIASFLIITLLLLIMAQKRL